MFVAWRDLRFARGRFALIASVVLLITLLVGFLGGLTQGLANANISAILPFQADKVVLAEPAEGKTLSFSESRISEESAASWLTAADADVVEPLGIATSRVTAANDREQTASLFGVAETFTAISPRQEIPTEPGTVVLAVRSQEALQVEIGERISIFGDPFTVAGVSQDAEYSHTGVIWMTIEDWRDTVAAQTAAPAPFATALLVQGSPSSQALDAEAGTVSSSLLMSLMAIDVFKSEIGSLALMLGLLLGISALVIGAFFTVWTIQRSKDVATLKALGASTRSLVRDALGQALVVLVVGVGLGIGLTTAAGAALPAAVPFVISPLTTVVPGIAMVVTGLAGAAFAIRSVVTTDPLIALNAQNA